MKNQKTTVVVAGSLILVGFILAAFFYKQARQEKVGFLAEQNVETFIRPHSPTLGPDKAKVYLVEFLDPECESCRMFYPAVKNLLKEFPNQIKLIVRYVPFHGNSKFAIAILEASRKQNKFWETIEIVFQTQPAWGSHHDPRPEKLWGFLPAVDGLDIEKLKEDMKDPQITKVIEQDLLDAQTLGVRATPSFFVNGKRLEQFGYEPLRALIKSELDK